eukprot:g4199.t1
MGVGDVDEELEDDEEEDLEDEALLNYWGGQFDYTPFEEGIEDSDDDEGDVLDGSANKNNSSDEVDDHDEEEDPLAPPGAYTYSGTCDEWQPALDLLKQYGKLIAWEANKQTVDPGSEVVSLLSKSKCGASSVQDVVGPSGQQIGEVQVKSIWVALVAPYAKLWPSLEAARKLLPALTKDTYDNCGWPIAKMKVSVAPAEAVTRATEQNDWKIVARLADNAPSLFHSMLAACTNIFAKNKAGKLVTNDESTEARGKNNNVAAPSTTSTTFKSFAALDDLKRTKSRRAGFVVLERLEIPEEDLRERGYGAYLLNAGLRKLDEAFGHTLAAVYVRPFPLPWERKTGTGPRDWRAPSRFPNPPLRLFSTVQKRLLDAEILELRDHFFMSKLGFHEVDESVVKRPTAWGAVDGEESINDEFVKYARYGWLVRKCVQNDEQIDGEILSKKNAAASGEDKNKLGTEEGQ